MMVSFRKLFEPVNRALDQITSYRLVLYFLLVLVLFAAGISAFGLLPYSPQQILSSTLVLLAASWASSYLFSSYLDIPRNAESDFISALILSLVLSPASSLGDIGILAAAGFLAMASKYVLVINRRHFLNPAAFGALLAALLFEYFPSWWVGTAALTPLVVAGGLLILRKMERFAMVGVFLGVYAIILGLNIMSGSGDLIAALKISLSSTALLFFAVVMLTEPLTSPYNLKKALAYALLVGVLYSHGDLRLAPEEALLLGNVFAFLLTRDRRVQLDFVRSTKEASGIYSYHFKADRQLKFKPGQFLEWTLPARRSDSRGNRRYLTIASSPTEKNLMATVKQPDSPSLFKQKLGQFRPGSRLLVSHLSGDFTLPKDSSQKLAFIAGGVGITPFRSMVKYLVDMRQKRDIIMLYSATSPQELAFVDLFNRAENFGVKTSYAISRPKQPLPSWNGHVGPVRSAHLKKLVPDYFERTFYISGPYGFITAIRGELEKLGVPRNKIKSDYFPGYG